MREIIFRGKRTDTGEWVYGDLDQYNHDDICIMDSEAYLHGVDRKTVGQYTGMKDVNNVLIFEGDIIECWSEGVNAKGEVLQRNDGLWIIYPAWQKNIMWGLCPDNHGRTTAKVIGNVHDQ